MDKDSTLRKYGFLWATLALFLFSLAGHWIFGWYAFVDEQESRGQATEVDKYLIEMSRDTLENWQSEFLQLMWQVAGLALLFYLGSPQSKEGDDRKEEKIDFILKSIGKSGEKEIDRLDKKYGRK